VYPGIFRPTNRRSVLLGAVHRGVMRALLTVVFLLSAGAAFAEKPKVSDCFKVHALIRADEAHYWADWTNACPYTIDSVYVLVTFADKSRLHIGDGVWPMYFVAPGAHRVTRFSVPSEVADFAWVHVRKITADAVEGLRSTLPSRSESARIAPGFVGDPGVSVRLVSDVR
jgi:hypothetical protein